MDTKNIFERIKEVSNKNSIPLNHVVLKLMEELGEFAQAFLQYENAKNSSKSVGDVKEEIVDVLLIVLDLVYKLDMSNEELINILEKKIQKWKSKFEVKNDS